MEGDMLVFTISIGLVIFLTLVLVLIEVSRSNIDIQRFKDMMDGLKSIVMAAAVLVGGAWTAFTFQALAQRQTAAMELEAKTTEVALKRAELDDHDRRAKARSLNLTISAAQIKSHRSRNYGMIVNVTAQNSSANALRLELTNLKNQNNAVSVSAVDVAPDDGSYAILTTSWRARPVCWMDLGRTSKDGIGAETVVIQAGTTKQLAYYVEVPRPGIYFVSFRAPVEYKILPFLVPRGETLPSATTVRNDFWTAQTFVEVTDKQS
jgi:hypothetical protein